tara:strand:+ start:3481 stop:4488 length:1008 start_codon:yes stop_codon:yes gene_type:complete
MNQIFNKVAVIGSNSFSGASYVSYLLKQGYQVIGFSRSTEADTVYLPYRWLEQDILANFTFVQADLNEDHADLVAKLASFRPAYIVNFAAQGMVAQSWETPLDWYRTNLLAQVALHDSLRGFDWIEKYVHVSTPEVYGATEGVIEENFQYNPSTPYASSRAACDLHLMNYFRNYGFPVVFTRAANVYGPGQQLYRIIPRAILSALSGDKLSLHGGGVSVRSFIHIDDVAAATCSLMTAGQPGEVYHISTDRFISIRDLVAMIAAGLDLTLEAVADVGPERAGKDSIYALSSQKLRSEFNWSDRISLEVGIQKTVDWLHQYYSILKQHNPNYVHKP